MTHSEFKHILDSLNGLSSEQMQRLRRELDNKLAASTTVTHPDADPLLGMWRDDAELTDQIVDDAMRNREQANACQNPEELSGQEWQQRLLQAGLINEIKPPITDMTPYRNRKAVPIPDEPLSETVIRERR